MTKWAEMSPAEKTEWQHLPGTIAAIAMLRDFEAHCREALVASTALDALDAIRFKAGVANGVGETIDKLVRTEK